MEVDGATGIEAEVLAVQPPVVRVAAEAGVAAVDVVEAVVGAGAEMTKQLCDRVGMGWRPDLQREFCVIKTKSTSSK